MQREAVDAAGRSDAGVPSTAPSVSVVLVTFNRRASLRRALVALRALDYPAAAAEFIVVDNGSSDGTDEELAALDDDAQFLVLSYAENRPPAFARNQALRAAGGEIVAFTDDDCEPAPGWLAALVAQFGDDVDIVQGRTVPAESTEDPRAVSQQIESLSGVYETCNIAYRRDALLGVGGFDETLGFFGEDTAAGWKVIEAGGKARFAGDAVVRHDVSRVGLGWRWRRGRHYRSWVTLAKAHPDVRSELFVGQYFLKRSTVAFDLAVAGVAVAAVRRRRLPLLLAVPYLVLRRPRRGGRAGALDLAHAVTTDVAVFTALVEGSAKERSLVL